MLPVIIADASPLIGLAKIGRLAVLKNLYQHILIPPAVYSELQAGSQRPGGAELQQALTEGWLETVDYAAIPTADVSELKKRLDPGEAEAIALALNLPADLLLIDEQRGRLIAQQKGVRIIGTGIVLVTAKRRGYISNVRAELDALFRCGYRLSTALREQLAAMAGE